LEKNVLIAYMPWEDYNFKYGILISEHLIYENIYASIHIEKYKIEACIRCPNPGLGLATMARACKGAGQEGSLGVTSHAPRSVGECEGMNTHTPK
jgi:hypothetical protein